MIFGISIIVAIVLNIKIIITIYLSWYLSISILKSTLNIKPWLVKELMPDSNLWPLHYTSWAIKTFIRCVAVQIAGLNSPYVLIGRTRRGRYNAGYLVSRCVSSSDVLIGLLAMYSRCRGASSDVLIGWNRGGARWPFWCGLFISHLELLQQMQLLVL